MYSMVIRVRWVYGLFGVMCSSVVVSSRLSMVLIICSRLKLKVVVKFGCSMMVVVIGI